MTNLKKNSNNIRKNIFKFYAKNMDLCDKCYLLAEDIKIDEIYEDVEKDVDINSLFSKTSIVLLTANKYEKNILHKQVSDFTFQKIKRLEIKLNIASEQFSELYAYWFEYKGNSILHLHSNVTGAYTIGGSADITRWVLSNDYLFPTIIISFGICFGNDESKSSLGDVIISKKIYPYFVGAKINGNDLNVVDDNIFAISSTLNKKVKQLIENNKFSSFEFNVKFGNYITGEAVVNSKNGKKKFVSITTQQIEAGEMEGYGVFKECRSGGYNVPCVVIKSICDWGEEKNFDENNQTIIEELKDSLFKFANKKVGVNETMVLKTLLKTLKNRIQAYSCFCAFRVFSLMAENSTFEHSVYSELKKLLISYNGKTTSCDKIRNMIQDILSQKEMGYKTSNQFPHRCIMLFREDGVIQCDNECVSEKNNTDFCVNDECNSCIYLLK